MRAGGQTGANRARALSVRRERADAPKFVGAQLALHHLAGLGCGRPVAGDRAQEVVTADRLQA